MSKRGKPTQVITITRSGNTVSANREDVYASGEVNIPILPTFPSVWISRETAL